MPSEYTLSRAERSLEQAISMCPSSHALHLTLLTLHCPFPAILWDHKNRLAPLSSLQALTNLADDAVALLRASLGPNELDNSLSELNEHAVDLYLELDKRGFYTSFEPCHRREALRSSAYDVFAQKGDAFMHPPAFLHPAEPGFQPIFSSLETFYDCLESITTGPQTLRDIVDVLSAFATNRQMSSSFSGPGSCKKEKAVDVDRFSRLTTAISEYRAACSSDIPAAHASAIDDLLSLLWHAYDTDAAQNLTFDLSSSRVGFPTVLGATEFSVVYEGKLAACVHKAHPWNPSVAVKIFPASVDLLERESFFRQEALRLLTFDHPCLLAFQGVHWPEDVQSFTGDILSVTELLTHNLRAARQLNELRSVHARLSILHDVICGLEYLHGIGVAYRQLHPKNVLLSISNGLGRGRAKLDVTAFFKRALYPEYLSALQLRSLVYVAPEELKGNGGFLTGDVYSFGVLACFLMSDGLSKWESRQQTIVAESGTARKLIRLARSWCGSIKNARLRELVSTCLREKPEERPRSRRVARIVADILERTEDDGSVNDKPMCSGLEQSNDIPYDSGAIEGQPHSDNRSNYSDSDSGAHGDPPCSEVKSALSQENLIRSGAIRGKRRASKQLRNPKKRSRGEELQLQECDWTAPSGRIYSPRKVLSMNGSFITSNGNREPVHLPQARGKVTEATEVPSEEAKPPIDKKGVGATPFSTPNGSGTLNNNDLPRTTGQNDEAEIQILPRPSELSARLQTTSAHPHGIEGDPRGSGSAVIGHPSKAQHEGTRSTGGSRSTKRNDEDRAPFADQRNASPQIAPSHAPSHMQDEPQTDFASLEHERGVDGDECNRRAEALLESGKAGCLEHAARLFKAAADAGNANAQINFGHCLEQGRGVQRDFMRAAIYFQNAARQGHDKGQLKIGLCHEFGRGTKRDPKLAADWYKKSAEQGNILAQANLAIALEQGHGVKQDLAKAAHLYRKAARLGNTVAQLNLGALYESGRGVPKDEKAAVDMYERAAAQGNNSAMLNLGCCYERGGGVERNKTKAIFNFLRSAEAGNATAQYRMGQCFEKGDGVKKNITRAAQLYDSAARSENLSAMCSLGILYEEGRGVSQDATKAFRLYQAASDNGHPASTARLARCFEHGVGVKKSPVNAVNCYKLAAEKGSPSAMVNLGYMYENGTGVKKSCENAVRLYKKAATAGNAQGETALGQCFYYGYGMPKCIQSAVNLYKSASDKGDVGACLELGNLFRDGSEIAQDLSKAFVLYEKAAGAGNAQAQVSLGECYFYGRGGPQDFRRAFEQFEKAAAQHFAEGYRWLGDCYTDGSGVEVDLEQAVEYYKLGAERGSSCAQTSLGCCYENGQGVELSGTRAVNLYKKAADNGSITAMNNLGILYEKGKHVKRDYGRAFRLYKKAVDMGNVEAVCNLADCYMEGHGVPKSVSKAIELYKEAATQGMPGAQCELGVCYYLGRGVDQDFERAVELFKTALGSEPEAQRQLGIAHFDGCGVGVDYTMALSLYTKSASAGNTDAYLNIGMCYEHGKGVNANMKTAAEFYRKAADGGNLTAMRLLGLLYFNGNGVEQNYAEAVKLFKASPLSLDRIMH